MTSPRSVLFLLLGILIFHVGCKDNGVIVDGRPPGIYGRALTSTGSPLDSVGIHFIYYTTTNPVILNGTIRYQLATPQPVTVTVQDPFGRIVDTLINHQQQMAGNYWMMWDTSVTNAVYAWRVQAGETAMTGEFLVRDDDISRIQSTRPLMVTDRDGGFFLGPLAVGVGRTIGGETIADSVTIVACKPGYRTAVETVRSATSQAVDRTLTLLPL